MPRLRSDPPQYDEEGDYWVWCTEDCPDDCMADHRGEQ